MSYGARAISEGGFQALPKLTFPGGLLIGDTAGFLNVPRIKGTHMAMKSGMTAAEALFGALADERAARGHRLSGPAQAQRGCGTSSTACATSGPSFYKGMWAGIVYAGLDQYIFQGKAPWTFRVHADHAQLRKASEARPIRYPKPDNVLTFDRLSSVFISGTNHEENQPAHLTLKDATVPDPGQPRASTTPRSSATARPACTRSCATARASNPRLQINAQNCVHCKTCDIKDPTQNINWVVPEGGGGPNYSEHVTGGPTPPRWRVGGGPNYSNM